MSHPPYTKPAWAAGLPDHTEDGDVLVYGAEPLGPRIKAAFVRPGAGEGDAASVTLVFDNGEARELDLAPLLDHPAFAALRSYEEAERMTILPYGHGVEWATGGGLSAGYAYRQGQPLALAYRVPEQAA